MHAKIEPAARVRQTLVSGECALISASFAANETFVLQPAQDANSCSPPNACSKRNCSEFGCLQVIKPSSLRVNTTGKNMSAAEPKAPPMKGRILVYSIIGCPHCLRAKNTLSNLRLEYVDVSVDNYPEEVNEGTFEERDNYFRCATSSRNAPARRPCRRYSSTKCTLVAMRSCRNWCDWFCVIFSIHFHSRSTTKHALMNL